MQRFSRTRGAVLTLLAACAAWAPPAPAAIQRIPVNDDYATLTFGGSSEHLPVRPSLTWRQAVAWARTMPAVQTAMQTCAARGYEPLGVHDSALVSIDRTQLIVRQGSVTDKQLQRMLDSIDLLIGRISPVVHAT